MKTTSNDSAGCQDKNDFSGRQSPIGAAQSLGPIKSSPSLLISVRSKREMDAAMTGGADIVDLKEPRKGALAPTSVSFWRSISELAVNEKAVSFSAALGESQEARIIAQFLPAEFRFAKVGPSGCGTRHSLTHLWIDVRSRIDPQTELVAVAYADHQASGCLSAESVFTLAAELGFSRVLIDTFVKNGRSSIDHLGFEQLQLLSQIAGEHKIGWALAGSIRMHDVSMLAQRGIVPNCYGVRGDVCQGTRESELSVERVRQWKANCQQIVVQ